MAFPLYNSRALLRNVFGGIERCFFKAKHCFHALGDNVLGDNELLLAAFLFCLSQFRFF